MRRFLTCCLALVASLHADETWTNYAKEVLEKTSSIPGWCPEKKAELLLNLCQQSDFDLCVEIGVFAGKSLFPIAKALSYKGKGIVYGIDAWSSEEATKGLEGTPRTWWESQDLEQLRKRTEELLLNEGVEPYSRLMVMPSQEAASLFSEESIDLLHLDGSLDETQAFIDLVSFFPKVKERGYILLTEPNRRSLRQSVVFLLERADLHQTTFSASSSYLLFRKNPSRLQAANNLILEPSR